MADDGTSPPPQGASPTTAEPSKVKIDGSKDLWQNITANVRDAATEQTEMNVLFVGSKTGGKTSIINRMLGNAATTTKATTALEYFYGKREERNVVQIAHFWELGQGNELAQLTDVVLAAESIHTVVVAIVVDCGDLPGMWDTLTYWLKRVDRRVQEVFARMKSKNSTTPDKMLSRHKKRIGDDHPDIGRLRLSGLPLVIIASRMDQLKEDTIKTKTLARTLRFLAHTYGASLLFTADQERETAKLRAFLNHLIFSAPFEQRLVQLEHEKGGLLIPAGKDSYRDIGPATPVTPPGFKPSGDSELDQWKAPFDEAFPPRVVKERSNVDEEFQAQLYDADKGAAEPSIDAMRKQKEEELELYRKNAAAKRQSAAAEAA